jgi:adenosylhomocysteine nucleosidase
VILAKAGIGKGTASATATTVIERNKAERILFTSVAGRIAAHVQVGDWAEGNSYLQHDMDASPLFSRYEVPLYARSELATDQTLIAIILEAFHAEFITAKSSKSLKLHEGLILSGHCFVNSADQVRGLREALPQALCVEMEGAAVAQVCHEYGIPYAALRTISDRADEAASVDFLTFVKERAGPIAVSTISAVLQRASW